MQCILFTACFVSLFARVAAETLLTIIDEYGHDDAQLIMIGNKLLLGCRYTADDGCSNGLFWMHRRVNATDIHIIKNFTNPIIGTWYNVTLKMTYKSDIFGWYSCFCQRLVENTKYVNYQIKTTVPIMYRLCTGSEFDYASKGKGIFMNHCIFNALKNGLSDLDVLASYSPNYCPPIRSITCTGKYSALDLCNASTSHKNGFYNTLKGSNCMNAQDGLYSLQYHHPNTRQNLTLYDGQRMVARDHVSLYFSSKPLADNLIFITCRFYRFGLVGEDAVEENHQKTGDEAAIFQFSLKEANKAKLIVHIHEDIHTTINDIYAVIYVYKIKPTLRVKLSTEYFCDQTPEYVIVTCNSSLHEQPISDYVHHVRLRLNCDRKTALTNATTISRQVTDSGRCECAVLTDLKSTPSDFSQGEAHSASDVIHEVYDTAEGCAAPRSTKPLVLFRRVKLPDSGSTNWIVVSLLSCLLLFCLAVAIYVFIKRRQRFQQVSTSKSCGSEKTERFRLSLKQNIRDVQMKSSKRSVLGKPNVPMPVVFTLRGKTQISTKSSISSFATKKTTKSLKSLRKVGLEEVSSSSNKKMNQSKGFGRKEGVSQVSNVNRKKTA